MERENLDLKARVAELESRLQWLDEVNRELAAEAQKLHAKYGDAYQQSPEYKALARRLKR